MGVLSASSLKKSYKKKTVVSDASITLSTGEVVGLLGPNGAGKTTTFYMIVGLTLPDDGKVTLNGEDVTSLTLFQRARKGIGYLPQEASIFRKLTVEENLLAVLEYHTQAASAKEISDRMLDELGIISLKKNKAYTLSGGERRRLEIARTLCTGPSFILLDEPFAGVDPKAVIDLQNIIKYLKDKKIGVLITDHNVRETLKITDRSYIMHNGEILFDGVPESLVNNEKVREIYLGDDFSI